MNLKRDITDIFARLRKLRRVLDDKAAKVIATSPLPSSQPSSLPSSLPPSGAATPPVAADTATAKP